MNGIETQGRAAMITATSCLLLLLTGCAPGFGERIDVNKLIDIADETPGRIQYGERWLQVDKFTDARPTEELVRVDGRHVLPEGLVGERVTVAFQDLLRMNDVRLSQFRGPVVRGEVLAWLAEVSPGFPSSSAKAGAAVRLMVSDESGRALYSATYNGSAEMTHPWLTESRVEALLGTAMQTAIEGALQDQGLRKALGF